MPSRDRIATYARLAGDTLYALSFDAHRDRPRLRTHDRFGTRIDRVDFHPNYHALMQAAIEHGVAGLSWREPVPGAHVARAALSYLHHQVEPGTSCPLTMTHAAVPALRRAPALAEWAEKAAAPHYDAREVPIGEKRGVTLGMGMTEKQGGSDVRANTTRAESLDGDDYALTGHKWFFSAPMSDGFLVLAQAPGGLTCFLLPRRLADGSKNAFTLMRLKDKLGDWSNASSEVEFQGARAHARRRRRARHRHDPRHGDAHAPGLHARFRGGNAHGARAGVAPRTPSHDLRKAASRPTADAQRARGPGRSNPKPRSRCRCASRVRWMPRERDPREAAFARIATAIGKYWICKRAPAFVNEAQECLGGNGYVEESLLPRLYRQAPLNSIWEGSGNIQCLDVLRALHREPETGEAFFAELGEGLHPALDAAIARLRTMLRTPEEAAARLLVERMALALQASILLRANAAIAPMFCESRLGAAHGLAFGTLPVDDALFASILIARAADQPPKNPRPRASSSCGASHAHSAGHPASIGGPTLRTTRS